MFSITLFAFSGAVLIILTIAKRVEEKHKKTFFVLKAISLGDERMRKIHHHTICLYLDGKDRASFLLKKQLPLKLKSLWNKSVAWGKESTQKLIGDLRDTRLLKKKSDGISEFFKNISEVEKGGGEINEPYFDKPEIIEEVAEESAELPQMLAEEVVEVTEMVEEKPVKLLRRKSAAKKPAKPRVKRRKMVVMEAE